MANSCCVQFAKFILIFINFIFFTSTLPPSVTDNSTARVGREQTPDPPAPPARAPRSFELPGHSHYCPILPVLRSGRRARGTKGAPGGMMYHRCAF